MRFIPYKKSYIEIGQSKEAILRVLSASISTPPKKGQPAEPLTKPYVGHMADGNFTISPRTSYLHRSSLRIKGQVVETHEQKGLHVRFMWTALDYLINGTVLGCFTALSVFCLRHAFHHRFFQALDTLPFLILLFAYFIMMLMFNMSVQNREQELIDLFADQYPD